LIHIEKDTIRFPYQLLPGKSIQGNVTLMRKLTTRTNKKKKKMGLRSRVILWWKPNKSNK
jgi:hypothetical protein